MPEPLREAQALVPSWAGNDAAYLPAPAHQKLLRELMNRFPYRLDTNFAKTRLSPRQRVKSPSVQRVILGAVASVTALPRPTVLVGVFFFGSTSVLVMGASCLILFWDIVPKR